MKVRIGTVKEDKTCFGNRFYIQIEDSADNENTDLRKLLGKEVIIIVDENKPGEIRI